MNKHALKVTLLEKRKSTLRSLYLLLKLLGVKVERLESRKGTISMFMLKEDIVRLYNISKELSAFNCFYHDKLRLHYNFNGEGEKIILHENDAKLLIGYLDVCNRGCISALS